MSNNTIKESLSMEIITVNNPHLAFETIKAITKLPSPHIQNLATTTDLKNQLIAQKQIYQLLALGLKAKFGGGGGNPAKEAFLKGHISKKQYDVLAALIDVEASMFGVYQTAWVDIHRSFKNFSDAPKNELEMYKIYFQETIDNAFESKVNDEKHSVRRVTDCLETVRDVSRRYQKSGDVTPRYSEQQLSKLESLQPNVEHKGQWHALAHSLIIEAAETDPAIKRALRVHQYYVGEMCRFLLATELPSTQWKDGIKKHPYNKKS